MFKFIKYLFKDNDIKKKLESYLTYLEIVMFFFIIFMFFAILYYIGVFLHYIDYYKIFDYPIIYSITFVTSIILSIFISYLLYSPYRLYRYYFYEFVSIEKIYDKNLIKCIQFYCDEKNYILIDNDVKQYYDLLWVVCNIIVHATIVIIIMCIFIFVGIITIYFFPILHNENNEKRSYYGDCFLFGFLTSIIIIFIIIFCWGLYEICLRDCIYECKNMKRLIKKKYNEYQIKEY